MPWACYWNLVRRNSQGILGAAAGASFFMSRYGVRVFNAPNTFVMWDVTEPYGTRWYYYKTTHVEMLLLLTKAIEKTWEKYKQRLADGTLKENQLLLKCNDEM